MVGQELQEAGKFLDRVAAVPIAEQQPAHLGRQIPATPPAGPAVARPGFAEHLRPQPEGDGRAAIAAAVVDDADAAEPLALQLADHMGEGAFFIAHRDDHLNGLEPSRRPPGIRCIQGHGRIPQGATAIPP